MATVTPIQQTFLGGEISPRLRGQVRSELYQAALALSQEFRVTPQGSLLKRSGSQYVVGASEGVLRHIPVPGGKGFLLNFYNQGIACYDADGLWEKRGAALNSGDMNAERITNGDFGTSDGWTVASGSVDEWAEHPWFDGTVYTRPKVPGTPTPAALNPTAGVCTFAVGGAKITQMLTIRESGIHKFRFSLMVYHSDGVPDGPVAAISDGKTFTVRIGTTEGASDVYSFTETATTDWNDHKDAHYLTELDLDAGTLYLEIECDGYCGFTGFSLRGLSGYDSLAAPWTTAQLADIQTAVLQADYREGLFVVHPDVPPYWIWFDIFGAWHCEEVPFVSEPADWASDPTAEGKANYPSVAEVFQGRLWLSGCRFQPSRIWASTLPDVNPDIAPTDPVYRPDPLIDFTLGDSDKATDALDYKLAAKAGIRWMKGAQGALFVGTELGEHAIRSQAGVICTTDIQVTEESSFGGSTVPAELIGSQVGYISRDGRKLRMVGYSQERQAWLSADLTYPAEHLFATYGIEAIAQVRDPDDVLVLLRSDGDLACCTHIPGKAAAWWRLSLGGTCSVESMVSVPGDPTQLWCLVKRGAYYFLEVLTFTAQAAETYLDCWVTSTINHLNSKIEGLPFPDDSLVYVFVGSSLLATLQTVTGGEIQLPGVYLSDLAVTVGFPYTATATTLPVEAGSQRGTSQGSKRRWPKVRARLNNSALPSIGGELPSGTVSTLVTQDVQTNTLGHGDGALSIVQALPYRTEILALFGVLSGSEV